ncbi:hypothetical protein [Bacillus sp. J33]|uniref:hypothetical protein n=1 Tax=Bacillus sp. J33 TaxID=935836 RepID=UPI0004797076|nr:hypothetical protein [Bacillus sp. J33]
MPAKMRKSEIAGLIEAFLDDNEDDLSPNMFVALEEVADEIDDRVQELEEKIEELEAKMED